MVYFHPPALVGICEQGTPLSARREPRFPCTLLFIMREAGAMRRNSLCLPTRLPSDCVPYTLLYPPAPMS